MPDSVFLKTHGGIALDEVEIDFVAEQGADVVDAISAESQLLANADEYDHTYNVPHRDEVE